MRTIRWSDAVLVAAVLGVSAFAGMAQGDEIKLKGGTKFSGAVLGRDGERVVIGLPRASVIAINDEVLPPPVVEGTKAPTFSVVDMAGATHTFGAKDSHVTLVNFWASWCPHCRSDVNLMKDLFAKYHDKGLRIITVSIDQDISRLTQFVKDQQLPYPVVAAFKDMDSAEAQLPPMFEAQGVPTYFLIDDQGIIAKTFSGSAMEGKVDLEGDVQRLLEAASPGSAKPERKT